MKIIAKYILVTHSNGKQKLYSVKKYRLLTAVKIAGALLGALLTMLLMCGMVIMDQHPLMALQLVFIVGLFSELLIGAFIVKLSGRRKK